jgi:hypothetical protein
MGLRGWVFEGSSQGAVGARRIGAMGQRTRIAVGSLLGALSLHVVMVACGSSPPSTPGDSGVLADVRDAVVDVIQDIVDAETPDAHAGGDGGTGGDGRIAAAPALCAAGSAMSPLVYPEAPR